MLGVSDQNLPKVSIYKAEPDVDVKINGVNVKFNRKGLVHDSRDSEKL